jgi:hypothetical protein
MKANTTYNDFVGTAAANISNKLGGVGEDDVKALAKFFELDEKRFKPIGIYLYGTDGFHVSLICVDKVKSHEEKEHIVRMSCEWKNEKKIINQLFESLNVVLYNRFDNKYSAMDCDEEVSYSDFHQTNK